jgi:hypothetical protein
MAARRYFRAADADLPRRGVFRTRGTQIVTGAEARRVAEEEARRAARVEDLLRSRAGTSQGPRQAFAHEPAPATGAAAPPRRPATEPSSNAGLVARVRRLMGRRSG